MSYLGGTAASPRDAARWPAIRVVSVENLFGRYSYRALDFGGTREALDNVAILYGDNGSGKTTLLKLIYACLSTRSDEGNRTYLAKTPFSQITINLRDGSTVAVSRPEPNLVGPYAYEIARYGYPPFRVTITTTKDGEVPDEEAPKLDQINNSLDDFGIDLLFLQDDRTIKSTFDFVLQKEDEFRLEAGYHWVNKLVFPATHPSGVLRPRFEDVSRALGVNLSQIMRLVGEWLGRNAFQKSSSGDQDASNVYLEVIKTLSYKGIRRSRPESSRERLLSRLTDLGVLLENYQKYRLVGDYPIAEFSRVISEAPTERINDITEVLSPYIDSVLTRLNAMDEVRSVMQIFESEMANYLKDKCANIHVRRGPRFTDNQGASIEPSALSSGEKQLVFLFCAALLSRDGRCIFLIDEPELSLNVKWQRRLISSLAKLARGADTQFVMATHSIEIMSRHRDSLIELR